MGSAPRNVPASERSRFFGGPRAPQAGVKLAWCGPFPPQRYQGHHQRRTQKQTQDSNSSQSAEKSQKHPKERQLSIAADQDRADEMIGDEDHDAAKDQ